MLAADHATPDAAEQLSGTMQMFEVSLMALTNGMADAGIKPPPNADISLGLNQVIYEWNTIKPILEATLAGEEIGAEREATKFTHLNIAMGKMNEVVGMYAQYAKKGH